MFFEKSKNYNSLKHKLYGKLNVIPKHFYFDIK